MLNRQCKQLLLRRAHFASSSTGTPLSSPSAKNIATMPYPSDYSPRVTLTFHEKHSSVALLTLCNPTRKNALTVSMMEQLDRHVQTLARWSIRGDGSDGSVNSIDDQRSKDNNARVVILTGSNGTFCAGLDLHDNEQTGVGDGTGDDSASHSLREGINMIQHMTRVTNQLLSLPVLSISAVDGFAVGGGAELTTCTDLVVMSRTAKIQFVHSKRGASTGWGGGRRLVNKVGRARALRMLLLGEHVHGKEEARLGGIYADAVGEEGETALEATMRLVVDPILSLPCSQSIRAIKMAVSAAAGDGDVMDIDGRLNMDTKALKGEFEAFMSVWGGESNREQIQKAKERLRDKDKRK